MESQVKVIELVTEKGNFTFTQHHASSADMYQAMLNFEANNWEILGDYYYMVTVLFEDDTNQTITLKGINASSDLACWFDEDHAEEVNAFLQSQY